MKANKYIFAYLLAGFTYLSMAQTAEDLVLWDFRSTVGITTSYDYATAPVLPDGSNETNKTATFFTEGRKITGQNGYVFSTGWLFDQTPKYWTVDNVNTAGYYSLAFMFDMGASSGNAPRDFEVEYHLKNAETWVSLGTLMSPQGFATKTYPLPRECEDTIISLRIRLTSNYKINGVNEAQTNTQNRLKNVRVTGYPEPTQPSLVTSLSTYSICNVKKHTPTSILVDITGKKLSGPLTLSVAQPFTLNKTILTPDKESVVETVEISFTPTVGGEYNERLTISGGGVETKIINLRVVAEGYQLPTGIQTINNTKQDYQIKPVKSGITVSDTEGLYIDIYSVTGVKLKSVIGKAHVQVIPLETKGIYLIQIGNYVAKVIVNN
ncbi:hypothetical protein SDC9_109236 [bioreactor metagenome]|uniref:Uncharacterized protein n=1 Tax=bioreactor metagenome TaxID=1076179 RepID=A0A645BA88_9ZZZZ|nr:hypothetical protein [Paludibacter sp.]